MSVRGWSLIMTLTTMTVLLLWWGSTVAEETLTIQPDLDSGCIQLAVVVADFGDEGCEEGTGRAVAENLRTLLAGSGKYTMIDRASTNDIIREQKLGMSELSSQMHSRSNGALSTGVIGAPNRNIGRESTQWLASADGAAQLGRLAAADIVIVGSVVEMGNRSMISARVVVPNTAMVLASAAVTANNGTSLTAATRKLAAELEEAMSLLSSTSRGGADAVFVDNFYLRASARWLPIIPGAYYVEEGLLHVGDGNKGGRFCRSLIGVPISEESYVFSGDVRMLSDPDDDGGIIIGIMVGTEMDKPSKLNFREPHRGVAKGGGGGTFFVVNSRGRAGIVAVDGKRNKLPSVKISERFDLNKASSFRIEVGGGGVDVYLDEKLLGSLRGIPNTGNAIAMGTYGRAEVAFGHILVTKY